MIHRPTQCLLQLVTRQDHGGLNFWPTSRQLKQLHHLACLPFNGGVYVFFSLLKNFTLMIILLLKINAQRYPVWASLARDYLAIMSSSVSSERAFSQGGITITKRRNRLKADIVEALQCLKCALRHDLLFREPAPSSLVELEHLDDDDEEVEVEETGDDEEGWDILLLGDDAEDVSDTETDIY